MSIVFQRASQAYSAGLQPSITRTIPAGAVNRIKLTLTVESWPAGPVGDVTLTYQDGTVVGKFGFLGTPAIDRSTGLPATTCGAEFSLPIGMFFPAGSYTMAFNVLQNITTSILIERF